MPPMGGCAFWRKEESALMTPKRAVSIAWLLGALAATGCGPMSVDGHEGYSPNMVPPRIETYPHTRYDSGSAYLVGNDWYYREPRYGWGVLPDEPADLRAHRMHVQGKGAA